VFVKPVEAQQALRNVCERQRVQQAVAVGGTTGGHDTATQLPNRVIIFTFVTASEPGYCDHYLKMVQRVRDIRLINTFMDSQWRNYV
jgi:hypothetical protein